MSYDLTEEQKPEEKSLTLDEARAQIGRMVVNILGSFIQETTATTATSPVDAGNKDHLLTAARELQASVDAAAKRFERPRILRPGRHVRIAR